MRHDVGISKFEYKVIVLCQNEECNHIQLYRVTEDYLVHKFVMNKCRECNGICIVCILSRYQKSPGFARRCKNCVSRFMCATIDIKYCEPILCTVAQFVGELGKDGIEGLRVTKYKLGNRFPYRV
jgi:hypothetical protein